jgi:hypothetical protein
MDWLSWSSTFATKITRPDPTYFLLWGGLMKEITRRMKVHTREELLHQIMDDAYISEHHELIQWAVNSCLE